MYMILFPLATFYFMWIIVFNKNLDMIGWAGISAVVAVNIVIISYVRMAWSEDEPYTKKQGVVDKKVD